MPISQLASVRSSKVSSSSKGKGKGKEGGKKVAVVKRKGKGKSKALNKPSSSKSKGKAKKSTSSSTKKATSSGGATKKKQSSSSISTPSKTPPTTQTRSSYLYSHTVKGSLIRSLLSRWWYAITYPPASVVNRKDLEGYDCIEGVPGVYVCTRGGDVGKIKDLRDESDKPNFTNFSMKPTSEIKQLLIKAIEKQVGIRDSKELRGELGRVRKVDGGKGDREWDRESKKC